jgi:hypothetical protein
VSNRYGRTARKHLRQARNLTKSALKKLALELADDPRRVMTGPDTLEARADHTRWMLEVTDFLRSLSPPPPASGEVADKRDWKAACVLLGKRIEKLEAEVERLRALKAPDGLEEARSILAEKLPEVVETLAKKAEAAEQMEAAAKAVVARFYTSIPSWMSSQNPSDLAAIKALEAALASRPPALRGKTTADSTQTLEQHLGIARAALQTILNVSPAYACDIAEKALSRLPPSSGTSTPPALLIDIDSPEYEGPQEETERD